jgi:hypothetical protein
MNAKIEMLRERMHREERVENPAYLSKAKSTYLLKEYDLCSDEYQARRIDPGHHQRTTSSRRALWEVQSGSSHDG